MTISKRLRFAIFERDKHACWYCGGRAPEVTLTIDHVQPVSLGGSDEPSNLVAACDACNSGKTSLPVDGARVEEVAEFALRWKRAVQAAGARTASTIEEETERRTAVTDPLVEQWDGYRSGGSAVPRSSFDHIVEAYFVAGIDDQDVWTILTDSIRIAMARYGVKTDGRFAYFCGVARTKLEQINKDASDDLGEGEEEGRERESYEGELAYLREQICWAGERASHLRNGHHAMWSALWCVIADSSGRPRNEVFAQPNLDPDEASEYENARLESRLSSGQPPFRIRDLTAAFEMALNDSLTPSSFLDLIDAVPLKYSIAFQKIHGTYDPHDEPF